MSEEHWTTKLKTENVRLKTEVYLLQSERDHVLDNMPTLEQFKFAIDCMRRVSPNSPVPRAFKNFMEVLDATWYLV